MNKGHFAALASLLLVVSFSLGQTPNAPPVSVPAQNTQPTSAPDPVTAPASLGTWDQIKVVLLGETDRKVTGRFTADVDFVLWEIGTEKDKSITGATATLNSNSSFNALGTPIASEAEPVHGGLTAGARLTFGFYDVAENFWVSEGIRCAGVEASFFVIPQRSIDLATSNLLATDLVRPFFDLNNRQISGFLVAAPGVATGAITAHGQADFWGGELNAWRNIYRHYPQDSLIVDVMAGFRYLDADEQIAAGSTSVFNRTIDPASQFASFAGNRLLVFDSFTTHNHFYGGQIGIRGKWWLESCVGFEIGFKLGMGDTSEELKIVGNQVRTFANGTSAVFRGGLFALPSNIGDYQHDKFTFTPELDFKLTFPVTDQFTLSLAFSVLDWNRVLRPGRQIERAIDITQIPNFPPGATAMATGLGKPGVPFTQGEFFLMGLELGMEFRW
jgi:hypothetical protein